MRLPKAVESEPQAQNLASELASRARPLWTGGEVLAPQAALTPALEDALSSAHSAGQVVRGLKGAQNALAAEQRGLQNVDSKTGVARGQRVSRLLLLADDGAERFYRDVESLVRRHEPRVLALRLSADEHRLGSLLFGPDQVARLLLVEHKSAVSTVLLALIAR
ncbi:MAG: hypothetical protein P8Q97_07015 [Myxococcota bacterium]|jgi:hypothetical protein|nr:hypothetical protein [Myxococcota bacterium]